MRFSQFLGSSYTSRSRLADCERLVNGYVEQIESGAGRDRYVVYGTPGRRKYWELDDSPVTCLWAGDNRLFAVAGASLYELYAAVPPATTGTYVKLGTVTRASNPAQIVANGAQIFVVSGGQGFVYTGTELVAVVPATTGTLLDGYFIAAQPGSQQFNISNFNNGLVFDPLDFGVKEGYSDKLSSIIADHQWLWLFGFETTEVWQNTGAASFPFERINGGFLQYGCIAPWSVCKVGQNLMWLAGDQRGYGFVMQSRGIAGTRISNHAVEVAISRYATGELGQPGAAGRGRIDDAVAYSYEDAGHFFYVLSFPTGDATWVYDQTGNMWHERGTWDASRGRFRRDRGTNHAYITGLLDGPTGTFRYLNQHFVGDYSSGKIYVSSSTIYDDDGAALVLERTAPHLTEENKRNRHNRFEIEMERGTGPATVGDAMGSLYFSDDGGFTWSNEKQISLGSVGQYGHRGIRRQLGSGRDRVYKFRYDAATPRAIVGCDLDITPGLG